MKKLLNEDETAILNGLNTPLKIQDFLDTLSFNKEKSGETCLSPRMVINKKKAHCIEGALLAGVALWFHNRAPLIINLKVRKDDFDHIITVYRENGYYGAISKTNHNVLRFRDPVYKTIRELVMSYFHEYFLVENGEKTLLGYTKPINLKKFGIRWITSDADLWDIAEKIYDTPIIEIVPMENKKLLRNASKIETTSSNIQEWK
ncbi:hypothetical protein K9M47_00560 [Candidatus Gracilibacteria bacterium]|nr:hypothetical protein [Candidatus Gracilibacteria bacterium]MCF7898634.1 hypothetical protein [Candidatus Paceibacterota bacterium]